MTTNEMTTADRNELSAFAFEQAAELSNEKGCTMIEALTMLQGSVAKNILPKCKEAGEVLLDVLCDMKADALGIR